MSEMADAIRALAAEKGLSEDSIRQTVENTIKRTSDSITDRRCVLHERI